MAIRKINIDKSEISVIFGLNDEDYICLTDMVKAGDNSERTNIVIQNWMRRKDTISYLGVWENLHNPNFNCIEFDAIKMHQERIFLFLQLKSGLTVRELQALFLSPVVMVVRMLTKILPITLACGFRLNSICLLLKNLTV